ncbi:MAG: SH3 domain-containing protein [Firmicutes bacterium]|nr:SH3 domain-containing protein [Bacillota bacterium]
MKKFWSCLLAICLLLTVIPVQPLLYAEEDPAQTEEQDSSIEEEISQEEPSEIEEPAEDEESSTEESSMEESSADEELSEEEESSEEETPAEDESSEEAPVEEESSSIEEEESSAEEEESKPEEEESEEEKKEEESDEAKPDEATQAVLDLLKAEDGLRMADAPTYEEYLAQFPSSYQEKLEALHELHPNWIFIPQNTGVDWDDAVEAESASNRSTVSGASTLVLSNKSGDYDTSTGSYIAKDGSTWFSANEALVGYFMDPRNFLDEKYIWQFESLSYNSGQTQKTVEQILAGTFMNKTSMAKITYYDTNGKKVTVDMTYAELIWKAGKQADTSPLFLASKIRQEVGAQGSNAVSGQSTSTYNGVSLAGYYNFYNIGASDGGNAIAKGLARAAGYPDSNGKPTVKTFQRPWTSPVLSIYGGAQYIAERYIAVGQDTSYLMRFNVMTDSNRYGHQYMTNIGGAASEASSTYTSYKNMDMLDLQFVFYVPVYDNMPSRSEIPAFADATGKGTMTEAATLRKSPSSSGASIKTVPKDTTVTIVSGTFDTTSGATITTREKYPYWFKIKATISGTDYEGYVCAEYVKPTSGVNIKKGTTVKLGLKKTMKQKVYYQSSNPAIASVDGLGNVKGVKNGTCTIYVYTEMGIGAIGVTVSKDGGGSSNTPATYTYTKYVTTDSLNYRKGAGTSYDRVGTFPAGTTVEVQDGYSATANGYTWYAVKVGDKTYYTVAAYLKKVVTTKKISDSSVSVASISTKAYTASAIKPSPTIKDGSKTLTKGTDYTLKYSNNTWPGTATITITGKGNYTGSRKVTFKIKGTFVEYVTTEALNYRTGASTSASRAGTLAKGTKVQLLSKSGKKADGYTWYAIKVDGKFYYVVSAYLKKVATAKAITASSITVASVSTKSYTSKAIKPSPAVKDGTKTLVKGTDYKLSYKNNVLPGTATITITGMGNYTGSRKVTFKIKGSYTKYVTTEALNYRDKAGLTGKVIGTLAKGTTVQVLNKYSASANSYTWYCIQLNGKFYYVAANYLKKVA